MKKNGKLRMLFQRLWRRDNLCIKNILLMFKKKLNLTPDPGTAGEGKEKKPAAEKENHIKKGTKGKGKQKQGAKEKQKEDKFLK